ncbi:MAG: DNA alkylation repair protein [Eubacteriales bacterium]|nr:DNA alkylation repair protein [Eubacteriales bacterium]
MKEAIRERLYDLAEENYRDFSAALVPGCGTMLGIRLPKLRALAKEIAADCDAYFAEPCGDLFEEIMLRGMVIGCMKCSTEQRLQQARAFIPLIENWSVCDSFCCSLKEAKKKPEIYWDFILPYLHSEREFEIRFGVVMMLNHFAHDAWLPKVLEQLESIAHPGYYVKMAVAWAASVCYIRDAEVTWAWIQKSPMDAETERMAVQKIMDSRRVQGMERERIRQFRQAKKQSEI